MKINGKVKVYWEEGSMFNGISLAVKFKLPKHKFYRTRTRAVTHSGWIISDHYKNWEEFWDDCFLKAADKNYLSEVAKELIVDYIDAKFKNTTDDKNKRKLMELLEQVKEFEVEVEYTKS